MALEIVLKSQAVFFVNTLLFLRALTLEIRGLLAFTSCVLLVLLILVILGDESDVSLL